MDEARYKCPICGGVMQRYYILDDFLNRIEDDVVYRCNSNNAHKVYIDKVDKNAYYIIKKIVDLKKID